MPRDGFVTHSITRVPGWQLKCAVGRQLVILARPSSFSLERVRRPFDAQALVIEEAQVIKLASQIFSLISFTATFCPANATLKLILAAVEADPPAARHGDRSIVEER
jgi:hypothetical protein